ncbi:MAG TPA: polymer-forming cytoskeletal protein [Ktedonobacterales bacterium]
MRAPDLSSRTRFAMLLAAVLGGVALFAVAFALPWHTWLNGAASESSDRLALSSGYLAGTTSTWNRAQRASCTPEDHDVFGKDIVVDTQQWYCGHVMDYGGDITVLGRVSNDVVAVGGSIIVSGEVDGRVLALGGNVTLLPGAHIAGDVQTFGGSVSRSPGVEVDGRVDRGMTTDQFTLPNVTSIIPVRLDWTDVIFWAFSGLVISLFLPSQLTRVRLMARHQPLGSLFLGLLAYVVGAVAGLVLVLTCLGIPLALAIGVVLWGGSIFGTAALGLWIGSALVPGATSRRRLPFILATVLGVSMLAIASTAPVIGGIIRVLVSCAGLGAVLLSIVTMRHPSPARRRALV